MKKLLLLLLLIPAILFAETPEEVVNKMVNELKATKDLSSTLNYVHWPTAFNRMSAPERQNLGVATPEALQKVVRDFLRNPKQLFQNRMQGAFKDLPPEQAKAMQGIFDQQMQQIDDEKQKRMGELGRAQFTVAPAVMNGTEKASVKVTEVVDGKSTENIIDMMKIDGKWYIAYSDNPGGAMLGGGNSAPHAHQAPQAPQAPVAPKPQSKGSALEF